MPLKMTKTVVHFDAICSVEEALPFLEFLRATRTPKVDLSRCSHLHTALLQLLLAARPKIIAMPRDPDLTAWLSPLLAGTFPQP